MLGCSKLFLQLSDNRFLLLEEHDGFRRNFANRRLYLLSIRGNQADVFGVSLDDGHHHT